MRFYRLHDTKLYNWILQTNEADRSFLASEYFSYDYSRNSYYCPKTVLTLLQNLKTNNTLFLQRYRQVSTHSNIEPLAFSHKKMKRLLQKGILCAKSETGLVVLFKDRDSLFDTGVFCEDAKEFIYCKDGTDTFALSKSLKKTDTCLVDAVFSTSFCLQLGYETPHPKKRICLMQQIKNLFNAIKPQLIRA